MRVALRYSPRLLSRAYGSAECTGFTDLQGLYRFINADGGAGYRRNRYSDMMMTSYVLDVLVQAALPEWEKWLFIDSAMLNGLALWIVDNQNSSTGAFPPTHPALYDIKMRVGTVGIVHTSTCMYVRYTAVNFRSCQLQRSHADLLLQTEAKLKSVYSRSDLFSLSCAMTPGTC